MQYNVKYLRGEGLEVKWGKTRYGQPAIFGKTKNGIWAIIDNDMWNLAKKIGIKKAFEQYTALIGFFSVRT